MANRLRAAFYRGGTSKAVVFNGKDLPEDPKLRDRIFLHVLGSPDPYGRQLNGMGGGLSSLSKVVIVQSSEREDADVDYTFVQIAVDEPLADYGSACGNMSSCVGPFAVEEGMVNVERGETSALVRIFDTNTKRLYHARFPLRNGKVVEEGTVAIPGVSGTG
ncbi:PrpF domain-containing protein, partial [Roseibium sp.]|uniref:PrpF domain-containing protein n=1 Tax=Roseibium sp. TaxID=1936156 RepID=UPI00261F6C7D